MNQYPYRESIVEIDLNALSQNVEQFKKLLKPATSFMAVLKADAYGHGAVEIAKHLISEKQVNYLAVALLDEALELRSAGITEPILLLSPLEKENIPMAIENNLTITTFTTDTASAIKEHAEKLKKSATVHLKVDTGMTRIGFQSEEYGIKILEKLESDYVEVEGIFTHFSESDNVDDFSYSKQQFEQFKNIYSYLENHGYSFKYKHCCNTAATVMFPEYHLDMVRVGIGLYGYHADKSMVDKLDLSPVMTFKAYLAYVKLVEENTPISYGRTYITNEQRKIGTVIVGYGDGLPRYLSNQGHFTLSGERVPIVGRVCMDQTMIDLTHIDAAKAGEHVLFFGDTQKGAPSLYELADMSYRFHYEILCNIHKRVPRKYIK